MGEPVKSTLLEITGIALIATGLWLVFPPAAFIAVGAVAVFIGYNQGV
jgi:hypothetical protein